MVISPFLNQYEDILNIFKLFLLFKKKSYSLKYIRPCSELYCKDTGFSGADGCQTNRAEK